MSVDAAAGETRKPIAIVGLVFGVLSSKTAGRNLNLIVIVIGIIRLSLGGGIF